MRDSQQTDPVANFTIRRMPGSGYQVTQASGRAADELVDAAIGVLEGLQSDTIGWQWTPSRRHPGYYVAIDVQKDGEQFQYQQHWFATASTTAPARRRRWLPMIIAAALAMAAGCYLGSLRHPGATAPEAMAPEVIAPEIIPPEVTATTPAEQRADPLEALRHQLVIDRSLRDSMLEYLSQPGFASDPAAAVQSQRRSVKLISDLDQSSPPTESIKLSNLQVRELVELLQSLAEYDQPSEPVSVPQR